MKLVGVGARPLCTAQRWPPGTSSRGPSLWRVGRAGGGRGRAGARAGRRGRGPPPPWSACSSRTSPRSGRHPAKSNTCSFMIIRNFLYCFKKRLLSSNSRILANKTYFTRDNCVMVQSI